MVRIAQPLVGLGAVWLAAVGLIGCGDDGPSSLLADDGENRPPRIDWLNLDPPEPSPGETIRARVRAQDPEGDKMELRFEWEVGGLPRMETGPTLSLEGLAKGSEISVVAVASDGIADSEPVRMSTRIRNRRPQLTQAKIVPWEGVARGDSLTVEPGGTDPDGDLLSYRYEWRVNGEPVDVEGNVFDTKGLDPGDIVVARVIASDGESESDPVDTARVRVAGAVPRIVSSPAGLSADGSFRYQLEVEYLGRADELRYGLRKAPTGMALNPATGEITWRPTRAQTGDHEVEVEVADARGTKAVQAFRITVGSGAPAPPAHPASK